MPQRSTQDVRDLDLLESAVPHSKTASLGRSVSLGRRRSASGVLDLEAVHLTSSTCTDQFGTEAIPATEHAADKPEHRTGNPVSALHCGKHHDVHSEPAWHANLSAALAVGQSLCPTLG